MSKTLISVLVIAVIVVGGFFIFKNRQAANNTTGEQAGTQDNAGKKISFSDFIKQGGSYKCDVKQATSDFENSGTMYVSDGRVSGEFNVIAEGKTIQTHFASINVYSYEWMEGSKTGFKVKVSATTDSTGANVNGSYGWNANQIGDYNCTAWTIDESKFALPADVTFKLVGTKV